MSDGNAGLVRRLRYRFDNLVIRHGVAPVIAAVLGIILLISLVTGSLVWQLSHEEFASATSLADGFWFILTRLMDTGTFVDDAGVVGRTLGVLVTVCGWMLVLTLVGLVVAGVDQLVRRLRSGRRGVVESGHTLILGWSAKVPDIVPHLRAGAQHRSAVVVLADVDTQEMLGVLDRQLDRRQRRHVVVRTGDPTNVPDLASACAGQARSVIIVEGREHDPSARVARTALALMTLSRTVPVNAEVGDRRTATALKAALGDQLRVVVPSEIEGRTIAVLTREPRLAPALPALMSPDRTRVSAVSTGSLAGAAFGAVVAADGPARPIGYQAPDGTITLNPPMDHILASDELLLTLGGTLPGPATAGAPAPWSGAWHADAPPLQDLPTLAVGWSEAAAVFATHIDAVSAPGTELHVMIDPSMASPSALAGLPLVNLAVRIIECDSLDLSAITEAAAHGGYGRVIVFCYRSGISSDQADARALLATAAARRGLTAQDASLMCEVMLLQDAPLAAGAGADTHVESNHLSALALTLTSVNPVAAAAHLALHSGGGPQLRLQPWRRYTDRPDISFGSLVAAARDRGECAVGWLRSADIGAPGDLGGGIVIAPAFESRADFSGSDALLVVS